MYTEKKVKNQTFVHIFSKSLVQMFTNDSVKNLRVNFSIRITSNGLNQNK